MSHNDKRLVRTREPLEPRPDVRCPRDNLPHQSCRPIELEGEQPESYEQQREPRLGDWHEHEQPGDRFPFDSLMLGWPVPWDTFSMVPQH